ncbi:MBL fold metallo-hydrolase [Candidatus Micrarchaeota archaeon]|nr:MBL fold metallo-hydrolase [Candidatus Micrarchaeota archaeon]MBU1930674.1 MBL fold metallo-hydrolase [Candidatus Micrarchaeota archaeon]
MRIFLDSGIRIQQNGQLLAIDSKNSKKKADAVLISHAHSDHYSTGKQPALTTPETLALIQNNRPSFNGCKTISLHHKKKLGKSTVCFHNAGHILGSGLVHVESEKNILVTSDFNPVESILFSAAQPMPCDVLVIETTFGLPQYSFPDREKVHEEMGNWIKQNVKHKRFVVLAGYATGKAQELTKICNEFANEIPLVHEKVFSTNKVYEKFGKKLGKYIELNHNLQDGNVLIMPPSLFDKNLIPALEFALHKKIVSAFASGWGHRSGFDKVFPLSDHADYNGLLKFVKQCEPKQVYSIHGFAREFAHAVQRKLKIPARALGEKNQQALTEFGFG